MGWRAQLVGGLAFAAAMLGFAGTASALTVHALAGKTYWATVPKTNVSVFVKTDKSKNGVAKTGIAAIECGGDLARVNPTFAFTPHGGLIKTDRFISAPGNTGNGSFDISGQAEPLLGTRIKATLTSDKVPSCFHVKPSTVRLSLANRKVRDNFNFQLAHRVELPSSISPTCPASSVAPQPVTVGGLLSPDSGGTAVTIVARGAAAGQLVLATATTAADGSFSYQFSPSAQNAPNYTETVTMNFPGGADRGATSASCSWRVDVPN